MTSRGDKDSERRSRQEHRSLGFPGSPGDPRRTWQGWPGAHGPTTAVPSSAARVFPGISLPTNDGRLCRAYYCPAFKKSSTRSWMTRKNTEPLTSTSGKPPAVRRGGGGLPLKSRHAHREATTVVPSVATVHCCRRAVFDLMASKLKPTNTRSSPRRAAHDGRPSSSLSRVRFWRSYRATVSYRVAISSRDFATS